MTSIGRLLDRSIVFSFDRTGFIRHSRRFRDEPEQSLEGRGILVTGGSRGIGRSAAEGLAGRGARIQLWARDHQVGGVVAAQLGGAFCSVDLADLDAVAKAAEGIREPLSGVVLNAGSMPWTETVSPQGHELMWASQVLGHLTLLRILRRRGMLAPGARVVWVASGGLYGARLNRRPERYQRHAWYAAAKRAQLVLAGHLATAWPELWMGTMHPGWVDTGAVRASMPVFRALTRPILRNDAQGADTIVWLLARREPVPTGRFWFDRELAPEHLRQGTRETVQEREQLVRDVFAATEPYA